MAQKLPTAPFIVMFCGNLGRTVIHLFMLS